jgi:BlaI family transcriptional regulator, penicillinase repressor
MARQKADVTDAEMAIMQVLWRRAESPDPHGITLAASTRQIADEVYAGRADAVQYATVQKLLERLEAKGFVNRDRTLFVHLFSAAVGRDELVGRRLRDMVEKLCDGSLAPVLSHLFKAKGLSERERRALRELIEEADDGSSGRSRASTPVDDRSGAKGAAERGKPKRKR